MRNSFVSNVVLLFCVFFLMSVEPPVVHADTSTATIGTGDITGVFYQTGGAIARIVNQKRQEYGIRFGVEATDGSVFNINAVISGDLDFGLVQSDRQYQAVNGQSEWKEKGVQQELRSIFSLYTEACTLCASADSGIKGIEDLKGKRVNIGNAGSGYRQNAIDALSAAGIDYKKDLTVVSDSPLEASELFLDGIIDAFFYTVGHPTGAISNVMSEAKVRIISMPDVAKSLVATYPYYVRTVIPVEYYKRSANDADVVTFGVKAALITSSRVPNMAAYAIAKEVFENFEFFKSLHTAFKDLNKKDMLENLAAPIHPGAMRYYKEAGLK